MSIRDNQTLSILIVEDEELFCLQLEAFILDLGYNLIGTTDNSEDAIKLIRKKRPDIVIMDIKINGKYDGIEVANKLSDTQTKFLFVTSFNERAEYERAKQTSFIGYIIKPFDQLTLKSIIEYSIQQKQEYITEKKKNYELKEAETKNSILVKHNGHLYKVIYQDILFIEAKGKLSVIHTKEKNLISNTSLSKFISKLPSKEFVQIHKSYLVNINQITKLISKNNELFIGDKILPIGRVYKESFLKKFDIF